MATTLAGKTISITGTISKSRKQYIAMIERLGGTFKTHVSNAVNYLIVGPTLICETPGSWKKQRN